MTFSDAELRSLAARATALHERWQGAFEPHPGDAPEGRLDRWREMLSVEGDAGVLAQRLALGGLDARTAAAVLGTERLSDAPLLPDWAARFNVLLSGCSAPQPLSPCLTREPLPFADVWLPFVAAATDDLRGRAGAALEGLKLDALCSFQADLLTTLSQVGALALSLEFRRFLAKADPRSVLVTAAAPSPPARDHYHAFVGRLLGGGLRGFFVEYAVLARLVADIAGSWASHVSEFCTRLDVDRPLLAKVFNRAADPGPVIEVRTGLSDPHHGRRSVVVATFASGLTVVYKPKDLGIDEAFQTFTGWLNREVLDPRLSLRTLTVLNRTTHGWVEFVEPRPCEDLAAVRRYYQRLGMLLCVGYVLGATDFHQENMIASGEQPVLLDLETMLQPMPRSFDGLRTRSADRRALETIHDSVLRVGLLPLWIAGDRGKSYDVSGIGAEDRIDAGHLGVQWDDINTDRMQLAYRSYWTEQGSHRPICRGELASARDHVAEIIAGFSTVYRALAAHRPALLSPDGPMRPFQGVKLRCLLRMTKAYAQLLNRRMHPEYLRDGAAGGLELERLARDFLVTQPEPDYPAPWRIYVAEAEALERLDIPYFSFFSDSRTLFADGCEVESRFFTETGMQRAAATVRKLDEDDLRAQTDFIRASLHARYAPQSSRESPAGEGDGDESWRQPALSGDELIAEAVSIAERIRRLAIRGADGGVTWLSMAFDPTINRMNFLPMTDSLYDGRLGTAFFLAALEHVAGGAGFRELALDALRPLRMTLRQPIPPPAVRTTIGGAAGLGGQLYALSHIGVWLDDDELPRLAARAAAWFVPARIAADESLDVFGGAAGGILGLLALPQDGRPQALTAAVSCGQHLLDRRVLAPTGHRAWRGSWAARPLTGFAHGAAGIAYALLRLTQASGEATFREAAEEGIAYESAVYSVEARNWPDFRANRESVTPMVAWCSGAAGVGLGRLGGLASYDTAGVRRDIADALETTRTAGSSGGDHLCCGSMGRLDLLIEGSRRLGRRELLDEARQRASAIVRRAARNSQYTLFAQAPGVTDSLSLFQGTAGIGYQLLRLAHPDRLPSVLLWE